METRAVMDRLYPDVVPKGKEAKKRLRVPSLGLSRRSFKGWFRRVRKALIPAVFVLVYAATHLYYYNSLISLEFNVDAAWAQVQAQLQRRHNIQKNLTKISMDYAAHERQVLVGLTELRAAGGKRGAARTAAVPADDAIAEAADGAESTADDPAGGVAKTMVVEQARQEQFDSLFSKLQLVAEQYPQLALSKNLDHFAKAVVQTETQIAEKTMAYNDAVNTYSTVLKSFPANVFGWVCGFKTRKFYRPADETMRFQRVEY